MKHIVSSIVARLTSWANNIVAGTLPRTAPALVRVAVVSLVLAGGLAFTATSARAQNISVVCNGVTLTGTQAHVNASMLALGCATEVPDGTYVAKSSGNVRSGPGTAYTVTGSKKSMTTVVVDAVSTDDYWCRLAEGEGWMACWLLKGVPSGLPVDDSLIVANAAAAPAAPTAAATSSECRALSLSELRSLSQEGAQFIVQYEDGVAAGVHMTFASDWPKACWIDQIHKDEKSWDYAPAGAEVTVWALRAHRPLR